LTTYLADELGWGCLAPIPYRSLGASDIEAVREAGAGDILKLVGGRTAWIGWSTADVAAAIDAVELAETPTGETWIVMADGASIRRLLEMRDGGRAFVVLGEGYSRVKCPTPSSGKPRPGGSIRLP
jgi:hypothetical protein